MVPAVFCGVFTKQVTPRRSYGFFSTTSVSGGVSRDFGGYTTPSGWYSLLQVSITSCGSRPTGNEAWKEIYMKSFSSDVMGTWQVFLKTSSPFFLPVFN